MAVIKLMVFFGDSALSAPKFWRQKCGAGSEKALCIVNQRAADTARR